MATGEAAFPSSILVDRLAEELGRRWRAGERPRVEEYLARFPELCRRPEAAVELIYEELCLRQEHGQEGAASEILERFPEWRGQLEILLRCHDFLQPLPASLSFPAPEESVGEFRLLAELGRGAHGRVYLAIQPALADRAVVLKLAPRSGREHLSLARLQHTHIMPLYSVEDNEALELRVLCMPYFGGATLAQILEFLRPRIPRQRTGAHLLEALEHAQAGLPIRISVEGPACRFLAQVSYVRAVCWLGICLAEALQYTHERDLVHMDLKPSNVLWTADGQPMLLDLHLARPPISPERPGTLWIGGTPAYMAPEHQHAMSNIEMGRGVSTTVDGRADLYSLGLILCEMFAGALPPSGRTASSWLRRRNSQVSVGLADILGKCLADDPRHRYANAAALADDLRRHLAEHPLRGVANRSLSERLRKWRRRRPYQPLLLSLTVLILTTVALAATYVSHEKYKARAALREGTEQLGKGDFAGGRDTLRRGLAMVESFPFHDALTEELHGRLQQAERAEARHELHLLSDQLRTLYGADGNLPDGAQALLAHCRDIWQKRALIIGRLGAGSALEVERVQNDLLDLAILWTHLKVRLAEKTKGNSVHIEALEVLDQAEALFGPSCVLDIEREAHADALGVPGAGKNHVHSPRTSWEHFAVGRAALRLGNFEKAAAYFDQALALAPQAFWPNFFQGKCAYQGARYEDAVLAFTACAVLAPAQGWCYYNRGLAYEALGQTHRAMSDYDRSLRLEPSLALAGVNRGMLHYRAGRLDKALDDLQFALAHGADPALVCYNRALVELARGDRNAALASLGEVLAQDPMHKEARGLSASLLSKE